ncbi:hypothetical protein F4804DRAFT_323532 [Jackrogersella minutella]|nr:hypothetical protein F4804DRAFT_323532 [Jackrogersella minutella]
MYRSYYHTTTASFSPSFAMTNPELVWSHHQEQKQRAALHQAATAQSQYRPQSDVKSSSASTFSGSTAYSYDKDQSQAGTPKRSVRQRIKEAFQDMGSPPTSYHDRVSGSKTKEQSPDHGPMSSTPQSRT